MSSLTFLTAGYPIQAIQISMVLNCYIWKHELQDLLTDILTLGWSWDSVCHHSSCISHLPRYTLLENMDLHSNFFVAHCTASLLVSWNWLHNNKQNRWRIGAHQYSIVKIYFKGKNNFPILTVSGKNLTFKSGLTVWFFNHYF